MLKIFQSKESAICIFLIFIQQVIVALSTVFIADLARSIASNQISWVYLYLFVGSLMVVYVPATFSRIYLEKVRYHALHKYVNLFVNAYRGKIHLGPKQEEEMLPYITTEGQSTISSSLFFFYECFSVVLNVLASLIALSLIINPILLVSYGVGFCLLFYFMFLNNSKIEQASQEAQESRAQSSSQLLKSWRNITINNGYNFKIWMNRFEQAFQNAKNKNIHNELVKQFISSFGMLLSLLPLLGTLTYLLYTSMDNFAFQALLVATLPRQIQMIQNMDLIIQYITEWADLKQRLKGLEKALKVPLENAEDRIQWGKIQFYSSSKSLAISSIESLQLFLTTPKRITVRGENGSGKSTLLKCLKEKLGGYYLPANPALSFAHVNWDKFSTGEQVLTALQEVCGGDNTEKLVLLDEWDANLDLINRKKLSQIIDQMATQVTIIEVVHRSEDRLYSWNI